jgi:hypothetical protein
MQSRNIVKKLLVKLNAVSFIRIRLPTYRYLMSVPEIPAFLRGTNILVPIKIDITYGGARVVDTFSWNLYRPCMSVDEFSLRTCIDLNLCSGFQEKISQQIQEQVDSFAEIVHLIKTQAHVIPDWDAKIRKLQIITMGIRHNTLDYTDKITWDPMSSSMTPEQFAYITCRDLGLPTEIRPAISNKIRETLFRWVIALFENPDTPAADTAVVAEFKVSDTKVSLAQAYQAVEMASSLWKRAKPSTLEETAAVPQPLLPVDKNSNASIWE